MPKVRGWVESKLEGRTLNLFGGVTKLTHPTPGCIIFANDINEDLPADLRHDAYDLSKWAHLGGFFNTVVFDPPYTAFQAVKTYGRKAQLVTHARDVVEYVLAPGGRVVSLGFNSTGMGANRGFEKESLALVNCGGSHNDYILLSERKLNGSASHDHRAAQETVTEG